MFGLGAATRIYVGGWTHRYAKALKDGTGLWICSKTNGPQCPQRLLTVLYPYHPYYEQTLKCSERTVGYGTWCTSECLTTWTRGIPAWMFDTNAGKVAS